MRMVLRASVLASLMGSFWALPAAAILFEAGHLTYPGHGPTASPLIADFDHDGVPDVVLNASIGSPTPQVQIFKGNGDGTLTLLPSHMDANAGPLAMGYIDGDAHLDLASVRNGITSVYLGNGDLTFTSFSSYGVLNLNVREEVAVGDVTGDNILDVIAVDSATEVHVYPGNGDGTLGAPNALAVAANPSGLAVGDFDGNGHLDIVAHSTSGSMHVFLNSGGGVFGVPILVANPGSSRISVGLVDDDAIPDLVQDTRLFIGVGDGTFLADVQFGDGFGGVQSTLIDVNDDGHLDVVAIGAESAFLHYIYTQLGDGLGGFSPSLTQRAPVSVADVAAGDLDGDGHVDVFATTATFLATAVFKGNGDGTYGIRRNYDTPGDVLDVLTAEVTGDAHLDVLALSTSLSRVRVFEGQGDATLDNPVDLVALAGTVRFAAGDVDGNGALDVVTANGSSNSISVFPGQPGGGFGARVDYAVGASVVDVAVGDLDGDLIEDVAALVDGGNVRVYLGQNGGALGAPNDFAGAGSSLRRIFIGKVTADAALDVVVMSSSGSFHHWNIFAGLGGGALDAPYTVQSQQGTANFAFGAAADVTADGFLDLFVLSQFAITIQINDQTGAYTDSPAMVFPEALRRSTALAVGDVNDDGHADLVSGNGPLCSGVAYLGDGTGSFTFEHGYGSDGVPTAVALGDLDGNGMLDVIFANDESSNITVLRDATAPSVSVRPPAGTGSGLSFARVWPVPAGRSGLQASLRLPERGAVVLELLDSAGRRIATQRLGTLPPGDHTVGFATPASAAPGVYWLRLAQAGRSASTRVVLLP